MTEDNSTSHGWLDRSSPIHASPGAFHPPHPHVPLRKASPHRLQTRRGGPHPLLYTEQRRAEPFVPSTSPSAASSNFTAVTAAHTHPRITPNYRRPETNARNPYEPVPSSAIEPSTQAWPKWDDKGHGEPDSRAVPGLRASRSISEGMRGLRERLAWQHEHGSGFPAPDSSWEEIPHPQSMTSEGVRESFKSTVTTTSSFMDSHASTERSSMATGYSSTSDFVKVHPGSPMTRDESFSVEDAIGMYCDGFETPSKRSMDFTSERSPERPSSSPSGQPGVQKRPIHLHRRSRSAVLTEGLGLHQPGKDSLAPPTFQTRTSSEIVGSGQLTPRAPATPMTEVPQANGFAVTPPPPPRDRYGFKKISHHVSLDQFDTWEQTYNDHLARRRTKWDTMMKQFGLSTDRPTRFPPKSEKIKRYVRKGIPPEWRGAAWFWYAGGPGLQKKHEGVYFSLLHKIKHEDALTETDREHIERDLNRTFPDNITFKPDPPPGSAHLPNPHDDPLASGYEETAIITALRRVLQAFAVHRPAIGYCQSLNFIAGLLLLFLDSDEEKSFLLLNVITSDFLPGTHGVSLEGANIDIAVLMTSLKELLPPVWTKLDDNPSSPQPSSNSTSASTAVGPLSLPTVSLATTPWFLTLYLTTLPLETALRIWDVLFLEGSKTLFRAALAIFKLCEPRIKDTTDSMEVFQIVQTMPRSLLDVNSLMELCFRKRGGFGGLSQDTVEKRREELRRRVRGVPGTAGRSLTEQVNGDAAREEKKGVGAVMRGRFRSRTKGAQG
ncbi:GTPase-activating protein gyp3 [Sphaceloma murrayae]|uniref:GTPase-activating protein gyp3 n=1 Tax=Sphaceloma murrayae TaxID=2082308 RepID=A0A2K1QLQ7_9PEZI|nr:GTPase-activating protein gyp3 [Sphaceloma murrayae]